LPKIACFLTRKTNAYSVLHNPRIVVPPDQPIVIAVAALICHTAQAVPVTHSPGAAINRAFGFFAEQSLSRDAECNIAA
jgi:hypothetical protein